MLGIETSSCGVEIKNVVAGIGGLDVGVDDFYKLPFTSSSESSLMESLKMWSVDMILQKIQQDVVI